MKNSKLITLTGDLGSGKSTVSKILIEELKFDYIYTGAIQRKIAERYQMSTTELNVYSETHPEIDDEIDSIFKSLTNESNLIIDSRLAWFFIPNSFKIFLKTNLLIAAERILADKIRKNEKYSSKEEAIVNIIERKASENKRYFDFYRADVTDFNNYNLILDTSFQNPQQIADLILKNFNLWIENKFSNKTFISPKNLFPTTENFSSDICDKINIIHFNSFDYILSGHKAVSEALIQKNELINVNYVKDNNFYPKNKNISMYKSWENVNNFKFLWYPE
ncbi:MAG: cytidylate kinase family protein [Bacteroidales bacterium]|jgi:cytidylate kinase|nr:cytidylate kinase family protein [Bacteroidales bacterium]